MNKDDLITVCAECLTACCFQGEFYCDNYWFASTTEKTVSELEELDLEHPDYWETNR